MEQNTPPEESKSPTQEELKAIYLAQLQKRMNVIAENKRAESARKNAKRKHLRGIANKTRNANRAKSKGALRRMAKRMSKAAKKALEKV